jgi:hypothetical protein
MTKYGVLRRGGWRSYDDLAAALERAAHLAGEQILDDVRWLRSYVLDEDRGAAGTFCVYRARSPEAIRHHAAHARLPIDEIVAIADTVIFSDDPQTADGWLSDRVAHSTKPHRRSDDPAAW